MVVSGMAGTILAKPAVLEELAAGTLIARKIAAPGLQTRLVLATAVRRRSRARSGWSSSKSKAWWNP